MLKDEIVRYLEDYVRFFRAAAARRGRGHPPAGARAEAKGGFDLSTTAGDCLAEQVVVATGGYHTPRDPALGRAAARAIAQLHSSQYRNPASLRARRGAGGRHRPVGLPDRRGPAPGRAARAPGGRRRAAHRAPLPRARRRRLAGRHGLLQPARARAPAEGARARQGEPLRHRPRRRARHRSAAARARRDAPLRTRRGARAARGCCWCWI